MKTKLQLSKNVTMNKPDEKRQGMKVRTVVTGHDAKGRAVFVRDEKVDGTPIPGLGELAFLWNANESATYPNAGNNPAAPGIFPPVGGIRFIIGTYLPGDFIAPEPTPEMHLGDGDELGGANAGFHRTDTTDFGVVLSGNLALQLDDGAEVSLSPGDVLIENGTRHRWRVVGGRAGHPGFFHHRSPAPLGSGLHVRCGRTDTDMFNQKSKGVTTMGRLADKNILITGGNSGIGLAAAQEFDREGARVAICGLNEGSLQRAKETLGAGSLAVRADVSNLTDLDTMFATIKREFGHLDGVFVNAGYSEFLLFEEVTEQSFDKVIAVNFKGAYFTIQKALPLLRQGSSVIINASVGARKGWPTTSTVSTCKAAVIHLARILSAELVDRGIRVNTLSPGPTDTAMFGRFPGEEQGEAVKDVLRTHNPSKRMADPLEIAKLAVYLASDDSAYVVGADFLIDGGVTAISPVGA
jgi:NAD(P)-dependent dehydrogenase (short-subunit alcohol dehydrogenase family)